MLTIKEMPLLERPRERLAKNGVESLSNIELLAILLKTGTRNENVKDLSARILKSVADISKLKDITFSKLMMVKGVGPAKASDILAAIELGKRICFEKNNLSHDRYTNSKIIYKKNKYLFMFKKQECFYCLYLNNKKELIERKLLFMGTNNQSLVHPREIFKEAYLLSASSIVCMHNHPSGDVMPSPEDIALTKALIDIGKLQQIPVVDHIIFGNDEYYSFYENSTIMRM